MQEQLIKNNKLDLLPKWQRNTPIQAAKITAVFSPTEAMPFEWLLLVEIGEPETSVSIHIGVHTDWVVRHKPMPEGYLVVDSDGLLTYANGAVFELAHAILSDSDTEYEIHQDGAMQAGASGKNALVEIQHYAAQYSQDGPIEVFKVTRQKVQL